MHGQAKIGEKPSAALGVFIKVAASVIAFGLQLVLAKFGGATAFGEYAALLAVASLIFIFGRLGHDVQFLRDAALAPLAKDGAYGLRRAFTRYCFMSVIATLLAVGAYFGFGAAIGVGENLGFWLVFLLALSMVLPAIALAGVRGLGQIQGADLLDSIARPILTIVICWLFVELFDDLPGSSIAVASLLSATTVFIVAAGFVLSKTPPSGTLRCIDRGGASRETLNVTAAALCSYALFQLDKLFLSWYVSPAELAGYVTACNFIRLVSFVTMVITAQNQPRMAMLAELRDEAGLRKLSLEIFKTGGVCGIVALGLLYLFGERLLLVVSDEFGGHYLELKILAVGQLLNIVVILTISVLQMSGRSMQALSVQAVGSVVGVSVFCIAIPSYGAVGAAVSSTLGIAASVVASFLLIRGARAHD